jgi:hypothetical protein
VLPICYPEIVQLGDTTTNYQLAPGDRIYVPSKTTCEQIFSRRFSQSACQGPQVSCPSPQDITGCAAQAEAPH